MILCCVFVGWYCFGLVLLLLVWFVCFRFVLLVICMRLWVVGFGGGFGCFFVCLLLVLLLYGCVLRFGLLFVAYFICGYFVVLLFLMVFLWLVWFVVFGYFAWLLCCNWCFVACDCLRLGLIGVVGLLLDILFVYVGLWFAICLGCLGLIFGCLLCCWLYVLCLLYVFLLLLCWIWVCCFDFIVVGRFALFGVGWCYCCGFYFGVIMLICCFMFWMFSLVCVFVFV